MAVEMKYSKCLVLTKQNYLSFSIYLIKIQLGKTITPTRVYAYTMYLKM